MSTAPRTLVGHLGKDREIRETRETTSTATRFNPVAECDEEFEVYIPAREYFRLSLATHERQGERTATTWHQLTVRDTHRQPLSAARLARKGDLVEVTGEFETFAFTTPEGQPREFRHFVVDTFRFRRMKTRCEIP